MQNARVIAVLTIARRTRSNLSGRPVSGDKVYSKLKFESGVHRVQRVPATEAQGRVHTSTATVAVLPEADEVELEIDDKDLRFDIAASGGPGGQGVNTTNSAVQITHLPTGMIVKCQDERSQIKNKAKGLKILRSRLLELEQRKQDEAIRDERRAMVKAGDRGRLAVVSWAQGQRRFEYNESGLLAELRERSESNDAFTKYAYDEQGRLVSVETDLRTLQYSYTCASTERDLPRISPRPSFFPIPTDALKCN